MNFSKRIDLQKRGITFTNKHLLSLEKRGVFPRRVRLGPRSVAWVTAEVEDYQARLVAARAEQEPNYVVS